MAPFMIKGFIGNRIAAAIVSLSYSDGGRFGGQLRKVSGQSSRYPFQRTPRGCFRLLTLSCFQLCADENEFP